MSNGPRVGLSFAPTGTFRRLSEALVAAVGRVPDSQERPAADPGRRATRLIAKASAEAAAVSGGLALSRGPLGIVTIVPDVLGIWRLQAQLIADIAATYRRSSLLVPEAVLWCLFRFAAADAIGNLVVQAGESLLVRRLSLRALHTLPMVVCTRVTQRVLGRWVSRLVPVIGPVAFAGYAYYDTRRVGQNAIELCERGEIEPDA
jgi:hypothetical protein